jgi:hypothetical protein
LTQKKQQIPGKRLAVRLSDASTKQIRRSVENPALNPRRWFQAISAGRRFKVSPKLRQRAGYYRGDAARRGGS